MNFKTKKLLIIVAASVAVVACSKPAEQPDSPLNKMIIDEFYTHFNNHDWQKVADMYVEKPEMKDPAYGPKSITMTKAEIFKKYTELSQQIPDVRDSVINIYQAGDNVVVEFESKGTGPDGKPFVLPICTIFELKDKKITKDLTYYDNF